MTEKHISKYQQALEVFNEYAKLTPHNTHELQWADEALQELVDRDTLVKPLRHIGGLPDFSCDTCGGDVWKIDKFCRNCGQRVKESKE